MTAENTDRALPALVLDTNATLDWLVFGNPAMQAPARAILTGAVAWLVCGAMRNELAHMLAHPSLVRWAPDTPATLATFDSFAQVQAPPPLLQHGRLVCSDPDDQVFIDLALMHRARWLLTHDRALHKLARRAAVRGLAIVTPSGWALTG